MFLRFPGIGKVNQVQKSCDRHVDRHDSIREEVFGPGQDRFGGSATHDGYHLAHTQAGKDHWILLIFVAQPIKWWDLDTAITVISALLPTAPDIQPVRSKIVSFG